MLLYPMSFPLESSYQPKGDQSQAIAKLVKSVEAGNRHQTLLGVTGSGKTFLALLIYDISSRRNEPFLQVACAHGRPN